MDENELSNEVIGAAIEVHKHLGPGLLESIYQTCLAHELTNRGFKVAREAVFPVRYKGLEFPAAYRADLVVQDKLILELKAVDVMLPVYAAQLLSYLRMSGLKLGLLINFNVSHLRDGIKRIVNQL
ncbi:MAG: GxxExxY protein [Candidatus Muproteobacteria bacterium RIFCSPHIGHO2_02_FULL_65_16]|uniref:GxxExxY protein n=1 Tax=Candidatus Muproteobacteria bacterium RIFCSPHIGHO2_02_FULL_65_16 TaxID=1817766 RepID=A0A1F6TZB4_9PROT|nr:MAG: GxxExxY protein [Candidatus Muproteobacteria bacterium RIFCSPHIGHO2_02_FULL_65_16]